MILKYNAHLNFIYQLPYTSLIPCLDSSWHLYTVEAYSESCVSYLFLPCILIKEVGMYKICMYIELFSLGFDSCIHYF